MPSSSNQKSEYICLPLESRDDISKFKLIETLSSVCNSTESRAHLRADWRLPGAHSGAISVLPSRAVGNVENRQFRPLIK
ncbi:hypothetical protein ABVT39_014546 [Epinephelus coioides]